jgi:hypothetical protein
MFLNSVNNQVINILYHMPTKKQKEALQKWLEERTVPELFKNWISEKQLLSFIEISAKTLRNLRYERKITYSTLFRMPFYYVPDLLLLFEEGIMERE